MEIIPPLNHKATLTISWSTIPTGHSRSVRVLLPQRRQPKRSDATAAREQPRPGEPQAVLSRGLAKRRRKRRSPKPMSPIRSLSSPCTAGAIRYQKKPPPEASRRSVLRLVGRGGRELGGQPSSQVATGGPQRPSEDPLEKQAIRIPSTAGRPEADWWHMAGQRAVGWGIGGVAREGVPGRGIEMVQARHLQVLLVEGAPCLNPDLSHVEEIGCADLMVGGGSLASRDWTGSKSTDSRNRTRLPIPFRTSDVRRVHERRSLP